CSGSASETLRVRLLSSPHARQAPTIASGPMTLSSVGVPVQERTAAPARRQAMPSAMRRSKFSWKTNHAMSAVAAPSSVSSNDAAAALVRARPVMRRTGPMTPPAAMAPASQGNSERASATSGALEMSEAGTARRRTAMPMPAPQYNRPASTAGWTDPTRSLAAGRDMPNSAAEANAEMTAI